MFKERTTIWQSSHKRWQFSLSGLYVFGIITSLPEHSHIYTVIIFSSITALITLRGLYELAQCLEVKIDQDGIDFGYALRPFYRHTQHLGWD